MSIATTEQLVALLSPIVAASGLDLDSVVITPAGRRRVVRVAVDKDGGVSLDDVADASRRVSEALDATDLLGEQPYVLEVGSPGVDRPLTEPKHWRRAVGRLVKIDWTNGESTVGRVEAADPHGADLDVDGRDLRCSFADVRRAQVQVEFNRADPAVDGEAD